MKKKILFLLSFTSTVFAQNFVPDTIASNGTNSCKYGDLDNDGDYDIIRATGNVTNTSIYIDEKLSSGNYNSTLLISDVNWLSNIALSDLDNDGDLDIVHWDYYDSVHIYNNNGGLNFTIDTSILVDPAAVISIEPFIVDLDNNGYLDILLPVADSVYVLSNNGVSFSKVSLGFLNSVIDLDTANLNNDNLVDFIAVGYNTTLANEPTIISYVNNGGLNFTKTIIDTIRYITELELGDIDNDNDNDILLAKYLNGEVVALINDGSLNFTRATIGNVMNIVELQIFDVDQDGDLDFLTGDELGSNLLLHKNNGGLLFVSDTIAKLISCYDIELYDDDQDGDIDILTGDPSKRSILYVNDMNTVYIEEFNDTELNIYPNPVNSFFKIEYLGSDIVSNIKILDFTGKIIVSDLGNYEVIDLSGFTSGLYFVSVELKNQTIIKTIIKN